MKKYFILILFFAISFAGLILPEDDAELNYRHILFEWEQVPNASAYQFVILRQAPGGQTMTVTTESLQYILSDPTFFYWQNNYTWYVRPMYDDGSLGDKIGGGNYDFTLGSSRSNASADLENANQYSDGITMFGSFLDYYSAAIDKNGREIWNSGDENLIYYNTDYYGQLFGAKLLDGVENYLPGIEFNVNNEVIWQDPGNHFSHHEIMQLPDGHYMGLVEDIELGPIPTDLPNNLSTLFMFNGYTVDGTTPTIPWVGDRLIIWDQNGNEVWSWTTHDYFSYLDYDIIAGTWAAALNDARFDWTHANAFWVTFDSEDEPEYVYLSSRHLSRISKIDIASGNVIWNLGLDMPSGQVDCGQDIGFSFQHSIEVLENGNIVTLDNGNISETVNDTPYPTTRGLEIEVSEFGNFCSASIAWEYSLSENLFGFASGNVQKLNNGNYLITTVGGGGTSVEVTPNNDIVWQGNYQLSFPNGAVYRANRLSSLYPIAFSATIPDMLQLENGNVIIDNNTFDVRIFNNGSENEEFCVFIDDNSEPFSCLNISSNNNTAIEISTDFGQDVLELHIIPTHRKDLAKTISILNSSSCSEEIDECGVCGGSGIPEGNCDCEGNVDLGCGCGEPEPSGCDNSCGSNLEIDICGECGGNGPNILCDDGSYACFESECSNDGNCDPGYTYIELSELPNSCIIMDQSPCFRTVELNALNDIISINNLNITSPTNLGTQNWYNGKLTRFLVGNYYDGGNVTLNILPDSIGDFEGIAMLYLNYNNLTYLPDSITELDSLVYLILSFNYLTALPDDIGNLSDLIWLDAGYNSLLSIPESVGNFEDMMYLWIFNNDLTYLPESICDLSVNWSGLDYNFLPYFGAGGNHLCGELPECIENSDNLNGSIDPLYYSFYITVPQDCCGFMDVNQDSIINIIDIIDLVNFVLSENEATESDYCTFDVNYDGTINIIDIISLVNYILGNI